MVNEPPDQKKRESAYDLSGFRVLIIDDSKFIAELQASSLIEMGVGQVMSARDGSAAKDKIIDHNSAQSALNIDVVIADWLMPEFSGLELLKWIRGHKSETIRFMPVIICSAYANYSIVEESRDNGATEVLVKPVSAQKLARRILHVIDNPRPFIKTADFFGPDRRRKQLPYKGPERRVNKDSNMVQHNER
jgi:CheY-like chemotaxis protein